MNLQRFGRVIPRLTLQHLHVGNRESVGPLQSGPVLYTLMRAALQALAAPCLLGNVHVMDSFLNRAAAAVGAAATVRTPGTLIAPHHRCRGQDAGARCVRLR